MQYRVPTLTHQRSFTQTDSFLPRQFPQDLLPFPSEPQQLLKRCSGMPDVAGNATPGQCWMSSNYVIEYTAVMFSKDTSNPDCTSALVLNKILNGKLYSSMWRKSVPAETSPNKTV